MSLVQSEPRYFVYYENQSQHLASDVVGSKKLAHDIAMRLWRTQAFDTVGIFDMAIGDSIWLNGTWLH